MKDPVALAILEGLQERARSGEDRDHLIATAEVALRLFGMTPQLAARLIPHARSPAAGEERDDCKNPIRGEGGRFAGCAPGEGSGETSGSRASSGKRARLAAETAKDRRAATAKERKVKAQIAKTEKAIAAKKKAGAAAEKRAAAVEKRRAAAKAKKEAARAKRERAAKRVAEIKAKLRAAKEAKKQRAAEAKAKKAAAAEARAKAKEEAKAKREAARAEKAKAAEAKKEARRKAKEQKATKGKTLDDIIAEAKAESPQKQETEKKQVAEAAAKADAEGGLFVLPPPVAVEDPFDDGPKDPAAYRREALDEVANSRTAWEKAKKSAEANRAEAAQYGEDPYEKQPREGMTFSEDRFKSTREDYASKLSQDEFDAAVFYTHKGDRILNSALRTGDLASVGPEIEKKARDLDAAISRYEMPEDTYVARGMHGPWAVEFGKRISAGDVFEEKGYTSTAAVVLPAHFRGEVNMRIKIPKGRNAAPVPSRYPHEDEFLLPRGSKFRVLSVEERPKDEFSSEMVKHIEVELV